VRRRLLRFPGPTPIAEPHSVPMQDIDHHGGPIKDGENVLPSMHGAAAFHDEGVQPILHHDIISIEEIDGLGLLNAGFESAPSTARQGLVVDEGNLTSLYLS
jgi:hypothetical protein